MSCVLSGIVGSLSTTRTDMTDETRIAEIVKAMQEGEEALSCQAS
jgi:hypothetical protein